MSRSRTSTLNVSELKALIRQPGCPVCRARADAGERTVRWFWIDGYNDPSWISRLSRTKGFCNPHWWQAVRMGHAYGLSHVAEYLLQDAARELDAREAEMRRQMRPSWRTRLHPWVRALAGLRATLSEAAGVKPRSWGRGPQDAAEECPLCMTEQSTERYICRTLVEALADSDIWQMYAASDGMCVHHIRLTLSTTDCSNVHLALLDDVRRRFRPLQADIALYFHRCDYRFANEPKGDEQTAWLRAVERFTGPDTRGAGFGTPPGAEMANQRR